MTEIGVPIPDAVLDSLAERFAERFADPVLDRLLARLAARDQVREHGNGRLALTKAEAAKALSISVDHLERHVLPELRVVRSGRLRLIPIAELEQWIERNAARVLEAER